MHHAVLLIRNNRVELDVFHAAEDILLYLRVAPGEFCDKLLYLKAL